MSVKKITMPQLGESVTEGTVSQWLVKEGEKIAKYDPLAEVMTDKVNAEVPSSYAGIIKELAIEEGKTVDVGEVICYIEVEEEAKENAGIEREGIEQVTEADEQKEEGQADVSMKKRYSPAVLRLAQENDIDLEKLTGTGKFGRITRKDVEAAVNTGFSPKSQTETLGQLAEYSRQSPARSSRSVSAKAGDREVPVTGVRKVIAENMSRSVSDIPHAWMMIEVDVTNLVAYRNGLKKDFQKREGFNLTFFAFFVKAVSKALKEFPELNSSWAGDKVILRQEINISIAVAREKELYVPVIKNADEKSIKGIAKDIQTLASRARSGNLTTEDMQGGTFTINNTGSFGSVQSMGIINHPQAAILQVESIIKKPVIIDGMFAARDMVNLCLSIDHRVLDGLISGQFLSRVKQILENISEENTPIY